jgi:hypothetical protein
LGIIDLRKMKISLLCKWWWKLEHEGGLWQEMVRKKYKSRGITLLKRNVKNSPIWNDLLKVKHLYLRGRLISIGNGQKHKLLGRPLVWSDTPKRKIQGPA